MNNRALLLTVSIMLLPCAAWAQASATCSVFSGSYTETFANPNFKDPNSSVSGWSTPVSGASLANKGAGFPNPGINSTFGERVWAVQAGDFTGDGLSDIVAISDTGGCHVDLFPNTANNANAVFSTRRSLFNCGDVPSTNAPVIAVGDVDADGKLDMVVASVTVPAQQGNVTLAKYYRNVGTATNPNFVGTDITSMLVNAGVSWHASGSQLQLVDMTGDSRADLVVLSSSGSSNQVLMFPALGVGQGLGFVATPSTLVGNANITTPIATASSQASCNYNCANATSCVSKGGTALVVADFNGDALQDIVVGSVSENKMSVFLQSADGLFLLSSSITILPAPLIADAADMDGDGTQDLIVWSSGNDCTGPPAGVQILLNDGNTGTFQTNGRKLAIGGTAQYGVVLNVDGDAYNTQDVVAGKTTGSGLFTYYGNIASSSVYNVTGTAVSKNVTTLDANNYGVVSVVVTSYATQNPAPPNPNIVMYVSNNAGQDWEPLTASELAGTEHTFTHFGADLRWKAVFTVTAATGLTGVAAFYGPGATGSLPKLTSFAMRYNYIGPRTYTRSGLGYGKFTYLGAAKEMLYSAAFTFPGYEAQLYAYNISGLTPGTTATGQLARVDTDSSVSLAWEAGSLLSAQSGGGRTLYTAYPTSVTADPDTIADTALAFSVGEATGGSSNPNLATMMTINALSTADRTTLINWLNSGMGDQNNWKLFDPGHSTPVFVGPPAGDANYLGNGYPVFATQKAGRVPIVLLGGNDGFLHAFNAATGAELWGFVPYNLLAKLKTQRAQDSNGNYYYVHQNFIDGRVTVQDIYRNGQWYTVAVVGEAAGSGQAGNNFYFALDITDTSTPKALWEFSDVWSTPRPACNVGQTSYSSCYTAYCNPNTVCRTQCSTYDSYMSVNTSNPSIAAAGTYGCIEAEHFDNTVSSTGGQDWNVITVSGARGGQMVNAPNTGACTGGSQAGVTGCAQMIYRVNNGNTTVNRTLYPYFQVNPPASGSQVFAYGVDGVYVATTTFSTVTGLTSWQPGNGVTNTPISLPPGDHYFNVWMKDTNTRIDSIILQTLQLNTAGYATYALNNASTTPQETCMSVCEQVCTNACSNTALTANSSQAWPQCGTGANLTCCGYTGGDQYCAPAGTCGNPESVMGQTYSPPAIGAVNTTAGVRYMAFFGSGYDNRPAAPNVGRAVYALDAYTGAQAAMWNFNDILQSGTNPSTIDNTVPGGVALADVDNDGYVDHAYVGDLEGRLWKINTAKQTTLSGTGQVPVADWPSCVLFDAGNPNQTGTRVWAPIITTPAIASLTVGTANVYFGTGGDDRAPDTVLYKFYSVRDSDTALQCRTLNRTEGSLTNLSLEWVIGDGFTNGANGTSKTALGAANASDEGTVGDRYWADPVISNGTTIYMASLPGKIESVNPCLSQQGASKIYGYGIQNYRDGSGNQQYAGASVFGPNKPWIQSLGKVRTAALVRNQPIGIAHGAANSVTQAKSDVFLQNFSGSSANDQPAIQRLTEGGAQVASKLRTLRWREVPL